MIFFPIITILLSSILMYGLIGDQSWLGTVAFSLLISFHFLSLNYLNERINKYSSALQGDIISFTWLILSHVILIIPILFSFIMFIIYDNILQSLLIALSISISGGTVIKNK